MRDGSRLALLEELVLAVVKELRTHRVQNSDVVSRACLHTNDLIVELEKYRLDNNESIE